MRPVWGLSEGRATSKINSVRKAEMASGPQVVFRVGKLKGMGKVAAAAEHNARLRDTPNADPNGECYELIDRKGKTVVEAVRAVHAEIDALCKKNKWHQRADAVTASEIIISASPEYFRPGDPDRAGFYEQPRVDAWLEAVLPWVHATIGAQCDIVSITVHLDETTPHIQIIGVPRNHRGELSHRAVFGGELAGHELSEWQTRAAEPVVHLGIERGLMGSLATHKKIKAHYGVVNQPTPEIPPITAPKPAPLQAATLAEQVPFTAAKEAREEAEAKHAMQVRQHAIEVKARHDAVVNAHPVLAQQAKAVKSAERDKKQAERATVAARASLEKSKIEADLVRGLPLDEVLARVYGAEEAQESKPTHASRKFKLPDGREIAITGEKWIEQGGTGGKGAINLVMHLEDYEQTDFKKAVRFLSDSFGSSATVAEVTRYSINNIKEQVEKIDLEPVPAPEPSPLKWAQVRGWLNVARGLPRKMIDWAHGAKAVYADNRGNAVFPRTGGGAFVRGTGATRFVRTIGSADAGAYVLQGAHGTSECWICESAIDALSIRAMSPDAHIIATAGNLLTAEAVTALVPPGAPVVHLAHDADAEGDKMATHLRAKLPGRLVQRDRPPKGKDWNDTLKAEPGRIAALWRDGGDTGGLPTSPSSSVAPRPATAPAAAYPASPEAGDFGI